MVSIHNIYLGGGLVKYDLIWSDSDGSGFH